MEHSSVAVTTAAQLTAYAKTSKIQLCNYGCRFIFAKGTQFIPDGHCVRPAGHRDAFIVGTFKAYEA